MLTAADPLRKYIIVAEKMSFEPLLKHVALGH